MHQIFLHIRQQCIQSPTMDHLWVVASPLSCHHIGEEVNLGHHCICDGTQNALVLSCSARINLIICTLAHHTICGHRPNALDIGSL